MFFFCLFFFSPRWQKTNYEVESGSGNVFAPIKPCNLLWSKAHSTAFYWPIKCLLVVLPTRLLEENKLLKWVMKHVFHLRQSLFSLNPLQLFAWSTINYVFVVFFFFPEEVQCGAWMRCIFCCSLYCIYLGSKLCFLHIYLEYHTETGQLIIIKQLCQKMFYLTFYIDCWINLISEVWMFIISPTLQFFGCQIICTQTVFKWLK